MHCPLEHCFPCSFNQQERGLDNLCSSRRYLPIYHFCVVDKMNFPRTMFRISASAKHHLIPCSVLKTWGHPQSPQHSFFTIADDAATISQPDTSLTQDVRRTSQGRVCVQDDTKSSHVLNFLIIGLNTARQNITMGNSQVKNQHRLSGTFSNTQTKHTLATAAISEITA